MPREVSITRPLVIALVAPIGLLLILGAVLAMQITRMSERARWVEHSHDVITRTHQIGAQIVEQEGAVRAYLLTEDASFFEPFDRSDPRPAITALTALVRDNLPQVEQMDIVRSRYEAWRTSVQPVLDGNLAYARDLDRMRTRRSLMTAVRDAVADFRAVEEALIKGRESASADTIYTTKLVVAGLLVLMTLVLVFVSRRQLGGVATEYRGVIASESAARARTEADEWLAREQLRVTNAVRGELSPEAVGTQGLAALADASGAAVGAWFGRGPGGFERIAHHALASVDAGARFADGEGIVGQAARRDGLLRLTEVPAGYLRLASGTGESPPGEVVAARLESDGEVLGVLELGFLGRASDRAVELIDRLRGSLALALRSAEYKRRLRDLLDETQRQGEELQTQQEELRVSNEELEEHATGLREAHARLEEQQTALAERAASLARASQYKSEFLANMSHELRTPLNSTLILARLLADNAGGNLTPEQVSYAETIHAAGTDLLDLINDILDLAKIEAGRLEAHPVATSLAGMTKALERMFRPLAEAKGLGLTLELASEIPEVVTLDRDRVEQILRNLLANAVKFTDRGAVSLSLRAVGDRLVITVTDTGIGISGEQRELIFQPFQQGEGGTNRKYGGTGLGLSISRQLAHLLGGTLVVSSDLGHGSRFTLELPLGDGAPAVVPPPLTATVAQPTNGARTLLVVEDDPIFARVVTHMATEMGFHCLTSATAEEGFQRAATELPQAIVLDLGLPDHSGLTLLARLKRTAATRHIPVHVVSASDAAMSARELGAIGFLRKPIRREELTDVLTRLGAHGDRQSRRILIIEDDATQQAAITRLLHGDGIQSEVAATAQQALKRLAETTFDCVVLDLTLPDASGFEIIEAMASRDQGSFPPIIVHTARTLTEDEELRLRRHSSSIVIKGARSPERLLDEVTLFLHQVESRLPPERQRMLREARGREEALEGRRVLVVEDDVRNVFALSRILEASGALVEIARNGREAVERVEREPRIELVLMDVMMPEMDGLEATRRIRQNPSLAKLPILVLTAKAMPDDHARCMEAGASDYVAKPIDVHKLMSMIRVWMPR